MGFRYPKKDRWRFLKLLVIFGWCRQFGFAQASQSAIQFSQVDYVITTEDVPINITKLHLESELDAFTPVYTMVSCEHGTLQARNISAWSQARVLCGNANGTSSAFGMVFETTIQNSNAILSSLLYTPTADYNFDWIATVTKCTNKLSSETVYGATTLSSMVPTSYTMKLECEDLHTSFPTLSSIQLPVSIIPVNDPPFLYSSPISYVYSGLQCLNLNVSVVDIDVEESINGTLQVYLSVPKGYFSIPYNVIAKYGVYFYSSSRFSNIIQQQSTLTTASFALQGLVANLNSFLSDTKYCFDLSASAFNSSMNITMNDEGQCGDASNSSHSIVQTIPIEFCPSYAESENDQLQYNLEFPDYFNLTNGDQAVFPLNIGLNYSKDDSITIDISPSNDNMLIGIPDGMRNEVFIGSPILTQEIVITSSNTLSNSSINIPEVQQVRLAVDFQKEVQVLQTFANAGEYVTEAVVSLSLQFNAVTSTVIVDLVDEIATANYLQMKVETLANGGSVTVSRSAVDDTGCLTWTITFETLTGSTIPLLQYQVLSYPAISSNYASPVSITSLKKGTMLPEIHTITLHFDTTLTSGEFVLQIYQGCGADKLSFTPTHVTNYISFSSTANDVKAEFEKYFDTVTVTRVVHSNDIQWVVVFLSDTVTSCSNNIVLIPKYANGLGVQKCIACAVFSSLWSGVNTPQMRSEKTGNGSQELNGFWKLQYNSIQTPLLSVFISPFELETIFKQYTDLSDVQITKVQCMIPVLSCVYQFVYSAEYGSINLVHPIAYNVSGTNAAISSYQVQQGIAGLVGNIVLATIDIYTRAVLMETEIEVQSSVSTLREKFRYLTNQMVEVMIQKPSASMLKWKIQYKDFASMDCVHFTVHLRRNMVGHDDAKVQITPMQLKYQVPTEMATYFHSEMYPLSNIIEVQTLQCTSTSGTLTIFFRGYTTPPILFSTTIKDFLTAIQTLPSISNVYFPNEYGLPLDTTPMCAPTANTVNPISIWFGTPTVGVLTLSTSSLTEIQSFTIKTDVGQSNITRAFINLSFTYNNLNTFTVINFGQIDLNTLKSAFEQLPNIGMVNVSMSSVINNQWLVTFTTLHGQVPLLSASILNCTSTWSGNSPQVDIQRLQAGNRSNSVYNIIFLSDLQPYVGSFRLQIQTSYDVIQTTAPIHIDASSSTLQNTIQALPSIGLVSVVRLDITPPALTYFKATWKCIFLTSSNVESITAVYFDEKATCVDCIAMSYPFTQLTVPQVYTELIHTQDFTLGGQFQIQLNDLVSTTLPSNISQDTLTQTFNSLLGNELYAYNINSVRITNPWSFMSPNRIDWKITFMSNWQSAPNITFVQTQLIGTGANIQFNVLQSPKLGPTGDLPPLQVTSSSAIVQISESRKGMYDDQSSNRDPAVYQVTTQYTLISELQRILVTGSVGAIGGNFRVSTPNGTTLSIPYNAAASLVQTQLVQYGMVPSANIVSVVKTDLSNSNSVIYQYDITFASVLGDVDLLSVSQNSLTGVNSMVSISTVVNGNQISGSFVLNINNQYTLPVCFDASATKVQNIIAQIFTESVIKVTRLDGQYKTCYIWLISFVTDVQIDLFGIRDQCDMSAPSIPCGLNGIGATATVELIQLPDRMSLYGGMRVQYIDPTNSVDLRVNAIEKEFQSGLRSLHIDYQNVIVQKLKPHPNTIDWFIYNYTQTNVANTFLLLPNLTRSKWLIPHLKANSVCTLYPKISITGPAQSVKKWISKVTFQHAATPSLSIKPNDYITIQLSSNTSNSPNSTLLQSIKVPVYRSNTKQEIVIDSPKTLTIMKNERVALDAITIQVQNVFPVLNTKMKNAQTQTHLFCATTITCNNLTIVQQVPSFTYSSTANHIVQISGPVQYMRQVLKNVQCQPAIASPLTAAATTTDSHSYRSNQVHYIEVAPARNISVQTIVISNIMKTSGVSGSFTVKLNVSPLFSPPIPNAFFTTLQSMTCTSVPIQFPPTSSALKSAISAMSCFQFNGVVQNEVQLLTINFKSTIPSSSTSYFLIKFDNAISRPISVIAVATSVQSSNAGTSVQEVLNTITTLSAVTVSRQVVGSSILYQITFPSSAGNVNTLEVIPMVYNDIQAITLTVSTLQDGTWPLNTNVNALPFPALMIDADCSNIANSKELSCTIVFSNVPLNFPVLTLASNQLANAGNGNSPTQITIQNADLSSSLFISNDIQMAIVLGNVKTKYIGVNSTNTTLYNAIQVAFPVLNVSSVAYRYEKNAKICGYVLSFSGPYIDRFQIDIVGNNYYKYVTVRSSMQSPGTVLAIDYITISSQLGMFQPTTASMATSPQQLKLRSIQVYIQQPSFVVRLSVNTITYVRTSSAEVLVTNITCTVNDGDVMFKAKIYALNGHLKLAAESEKVWKQHTIQYTINDAFIELFGRARDISYCLSSATFIFLENGNLVHRTIEISAFKDQSETVILATTTASIYDNYNSNASHSNRKVALSIPTATTSSSRYTCTQFQSIKLPEFNLSSPHRAIFDDSDYIVSIQAQFGIVYFSLSVRNMVQYLTGTLTGSPKLIVSSNIKNINAVLQNVYYQSMTMPPSFVELLNASLIALDRLPHNGNASAIHTITIPIQLIAYIPAPQFTINGVKDRVMNEDSELVFKHIQAFTIDKANISYNVSIGVNHGSVKLSLGDDFSQHEISSSNLQVKQYTIPYQSLNTTLSSILYRPLANYYGVDVVTLIIQYADISMLQHENVSINTQPSVLYLNVLIEPVNDPPVVNWDYTNLPFENSVTNNTIAVKYCDKIAQDGVALPSLVISDPDVDGALSNSLYVMEFSIQISYGTIQYVGTDFNSLMLRPGPVIAPNVSQSLQFNCSISNAIAVFSQLKYYPPHMGVQQGTTIGNALIQIVISDNGYLSNKPNTYNSSAVVYTNLSIQFIFDNAAIDANLLRFKTDNVEIGRDQVVPFSTLLIVRDSVSFPQNCASSSVACNVTFAAMNGWLINTLHNETWTRTIMFSIMKGVALNKTIHNILYKPNGGKEPVDTISLYNYNTLLSELHVIIKLTIIAPVIQLPIDYSAVSVGHSIAINQIQVVGDYTSESLMNISLSIPYGTVTIGGSMQNASPYNRRWCSTSSSSSRSSSTNVLHNTPSGIYIYKQSAQSIGIYGQIRSINEMFSSNLIWYNSVLSRVGYVNLTLFTYLEPSSPLKAANYEYPIYVVPEIVVNDITLQQATYEPFIVQNKLLILENEVTIQYQGEPINNVLQMYTFTNCHTVLTLKFQSNKGTIDLPHTLQCVADASHRNVSGAKNFELTFNGNFTCLAEIVSQFTYNASSNAKYWDSITISLSLHNTILHSARLNVFIAPRVVIPISSSIQNYTFFQRTQQSSEPVLLGLYKDAIYIRMTDYNATIAQIVRLDVTVQNGTLNIEEKNYIPNLSLELTKFQSPKLTILGLVPDLLKCINVIEYMPTASVHAFAGDTISFQLSTELEGHASTNTPISSLTDETLRVPVVIVTSSDMGQEGFKQLQYELLVRNRAIVSIDQGMSFNLKNVSISAVQKDNNPNQFLWLQVNCNGDYGNISVLIDILPFNLFDKMISHCSLYAEGTLSNLNTLLSNILYTPKVDYYGMVTIDYSIKVIDYNTSAPEKTSINRNCSSSRDNSSSSSEGNSQSQCSSGIDNGGDRTVRQYINIIPVNHPPQLSCSSTFRNGSLISSSETVTLSNTFVVDDIDLRGRDIPILVNITALHGGLLKLSPTVGHMNVSTFEWSRDCRIIGSLTTVNQALNTLQYKSVLDHTGVDVITVVVKDQFYFIQPRIAKDVRCHVQLQLHQQNHPPVITIIQINDTSLNAALNTTTFTRPAMPVKQSHPGSSKYSIRIEDVDCKHNISISSMMLTSLYTSGGGSFTIPNLALSNYTLVDKINSGTGLQNITFITTLTQLNRIVAEISCTNRQLQDKLETILQIRVNDMGHNITNFQPLSASIDINCQYMHQFTEPCPLYFYQTMPLGRVASSSDASSSSSTSGNGTLFSSIQSSVLLNNVAIYNAAPQPDAMKWEKMVTLTTKVIYASQFEIQKIQLQCNVCHLYAFQIQTKANSNSGTIAGKFRLQFTLPYLTNITFFINIDANAVAKVQDERIFPTSQPGFNVGDSIESKINSALVADLVNTIKVDISKDWPTDPQGGNSWRVTFRNVLEPIPQPTVQLYTLTGASGISVQILQAVPVVALQGYFLLLFNNFTTKSIPVNSSALQFQSVLESIPILDVVKVNRLAQRNTFGTKIGYTWLVTFFDNALNFPLLSVPAYYESDVNTSSMYPAALPLNKKLQSPSNNINNFFNKFYTNLTITRVQEGFGQSIKFNVQINAQPISTVYTLTTVANSSLSGSFKLQIDYAIYGGTVVITDDIQFNSVPNILSENYLDISLGGRQYQSLESKLLKLLQSIPTDYCNGLQLSLGVQVSRIGPDNMNGYTWRITLSNAPYNFPNIVINSTRNLSGINAAAMLQKVQFGNDVRGNFTLSFGNEITTSIPYNASILDIECIFRKLRTFQVNSFSSSNNFSIYQSPIDLIYGRNFTIAIFESGHQSIEASNPVTEALTINTSQLNGTGVYGKVIRYSTFESSKFSLSSAGAISVSSSSRSNSMYFTVNNMEFYQPQSDRVVMKGSLDSINALLPQLKFTPSRYFFGNVQIQYNIKLPLSLPALNSSTPPSYRMYFTVTPPLKYECTLVYKPNSIQVFGRNPIKLEGLKLTMRPLLNYKWVYVTLRSISGRLYQNLNPYSSNCKQCENQSELNITAHYGTVNSKLAKVSYQSAFNNVGYDEIKVVTFDGLNSTSISSELIIPVRILASYIGLYIDINSTFNSQTKNTQRYDRFQLIIPPNDMYTLPKVKLINLNHNLVTTPSEYGVLVASDVSLHTITVTAQIGQVQLVNVENIEILQGQLQEPNSIIQIRGTLNALNNVLSHLQYIPVRYFAGEDAITIQFTGNQNATPSIPTIQSKRTIDVRVMSEVVLPVITNVVSSVLIHIDEDELFHFNNISLQLPSATTTSSSVISCSSDVCSPTITAPYITINPVEHFSLYASQILQPDVKNDVDGTTTTTNSTWRHYKVSSNVYNARYFCKSSATSLLYFQGFDPLYGAELWQTDGTDSGTRMVADVVPGANSFSPSYLVEINGNIYFSGIGKDFSYVLTTDTCSGNRKSSINNNILFVVSNDTMWQQTKHYDCPYGYTWMTTKQGQTLFKSVSSSAKSSSNETFVYWNQCGWNGYSYKAQTRYYFRFADSDKTWAYKHSGRLDSYAIEYASTVNNFAGIICLACNSGTGCSNKSNELQVSFTGAELYSFNPTQNIISRVADINRGEKGSNPSHLLAYNSKYIIFQARTIEYGVELYRSDGTSTGTVLLEDINPGPSDSDPKYFTVFNGDNNVYFAASSSVIGRELYVTSVFTSVQFTNTSVVKDICAGFRSSSPQYLVSTSQYLFFSADDCIHGRELWKTDGTIAGTVMVKDLNTMNNVDSNPSYLVAYQNKVYFQATADTTIYGSELYVSDGTSGGTYLLIDIVSGTRGSFPSYMSIINVGIRNTIATQMIAFCLVQSDDSCVFYGTNGIQTMPLFKETTDPLLPVFKYQIDPNSIEPTNGFINYQNGMYFSAKPGYNATDYGNLFTDKRGKTKHQFKLNITVSGGELRGNINSTLQVNRTLLPLFARSNGSTTSRSSSILLQGTILELNHALRELVYKPVPHWNSVQNGAQPLIEIQYNVSQNLTAKVYTQYVFINPVPDTPMIIINGTYQTCVNCTVNPPPSAYYLREDSILQFRQNITIQMVDCVFDIDASTSRLYYLNPCTLSLSISTQTGTLLLQNDQFQSKTFVGSLELLNSILSTIQYKGGVDYNGVDNLTISATRNDNSLTTTATTTLAIPIYIIPVNDAPVITQLVNYYEAYEDTVLYIRNGTIIGIDAARRDRFHLQIEVQYGFITFVHNSTTLQYINGTGQRDRYVHVIGTLKQCNALLKDMMYVSALNWNSIVADVYDTMTITVNYQQAANNYGSFLLYINVLQVPDLLQFQLPMLGPESIAVDNVNIVGQPSYNSASQYLGIEDVPLVFLNTSLQSLDCTTTSIYVVSLLARHGKISFTNAIANVGLLVQTTSGYSVTIQGNMVNVNRQLNSFTYTSDPNYYGADVITMSAMSKDDEQHSQSLPTTIALNVTLLPVNDSPVWSTPRYIALNNETNENVLLQNIYFTDVDCSNANSNANLNNTCIMELTIEADYGTIAIVDNVPPSNYTFLYSTSNNSPYIVVRANYRVLNILLSNLEFQLDRNAINGVQFDGFVHIQPRISFTIDDLNNQYGIGGTSVQSQTVYILLTNIANKAPEIHTASLNIQLNEDESFVFQDLYISDPDLQYTFGSTVQVSIKTVAGSFQFNALYANSGLYYVIRNASQVVVQGSIESINNALNYSTYTGPANYYGVDELEIVVNDLGNTGYGGNQTVAQIIVINIAPVEDSLIWQHNDIESGKQVYETSANKPIYLTDIAVYDPDTIVNLDQHINGNIHVNITSVRGNGGFLLASYKGLQVLNYTTYFNANTITASAYSQVWYYYSFLSLQGTLTDINHALQGFIYISSSAYTEVNSTGFHTVRLITYKSDSPLLSNLTVSINILPSNDDLYIALNLPKNTQTMDANTVQLIPPVEIVSNKANTDVIEVRFNTSDGVIYFENSMQLPEVRNSYDVVENTTLYVRLQGSKMALNRLLKEVLFQPFHTFYGLTSIVVSVYNLQNSNIYAYLQDLQSVLVIVKEINRPPRIFVNSNISLHENETIRVQNVPYPVVFELNDNNRNTRDLHQKSTLYKSEMAPMGTHLDTFGIETDYQHKAVGSSNVTSWNSTTICTTPTNYLVLNTTLMVLTCTHPQYGTELYQTDGTEVVLLQDIMPGTSSSSPSYLQLYNNNIYFSAQGIDLNWQLVHKDQCNGARQSTFQPTIRFVVGESDEWNVNRAYDCPVGYSWATTRDANIYFVGLQPNESSFNEPMTYFGQCGWQGYTFGNKARTCFRFKDSKTTGACKHTGKRESYMIDIDYSTSSFAGIVCVADTAAYHKVTRQLWYTDPNFNTQMLVNQNAKFDYWNPSHLTVFNNELYFQANTIEYGVELFRTEGNTITLTADIALGGSSSSPEFLTPAVINSNLLLFFTAFTGFYGKELYAYSPTTSGSAYLVADICAGIGSSNPNAFVQYNNIVLFQASNCIHGTELWRSDGTTVGTYMVKDINTGSSGSSPKYFIQYGNFVYFQADDGLHGAELWRSDGTSSGTVLLMDLTSGFQGSNVQYLTLASPGMRNNIMLPLKLYFTSNNKLNGKYSLHEYNAAQNSLQTIVTSIKIDSEAMNQMVNAKFGVFNNRLFYPGFANDGDTASYFVDNFRGSGIPQKYQSIYVYDSDSLIHHDLIYTVTLACQVGFIQLMNRTEVDIKFSIGNGTYASSLKFQGTLVNVNKAITDVYYTPPVHYNGMDALTISVNDTAPVSSDNKTYSVTQTIGISISPYNNPPIISSQIEYEVNADEVLSLQGINIDDIDAREVDFTLNVEVSCRFGQLNVQQNQLEVYILPFSQFSKSRIEIISTLEGINDVLNRLQYQCRLNDGCLKGTRDALTIQAADNGNIGQGGDQFVVQTVPIYILPR